MNEDKDIYLPRYRTDFLVSSPSFLTGMGTVFNLWGHYFDYNTSKSEEDADNKALHGDWAVVGQELKDAMKALAPKSG